MRGQHAFDERGFSLIETLIAASILATALTALSQLLVITSAATDNAGRMTTATVLASQKIEDLRASSSTVLEGGGTDMPAPGFVRRWRFSALPSDPDHVIVVEAVVTTRGSSTRLIALRTIAP
jgi:prepilin-type N-terminal cleavage/methylation domain-containing protein